MLGSRTGVGYNDGVSPSKKFLPYKPEFETGCIIEIAGS